MFFCKKSDNRAIAFVDYEYWYVSMKNRFGIKPDIKDWCTAIRENHRMENILFFANFLQGGLPEEISRSAAPADRDKILPGRKVGSDMGRPPF